MAIVDKDTKVLIVTIKANTPIAIPLYEFPLYVAWVDIKHTVTNNIVNSNPKEDLITGLKVENLTESIKKLKNNFLSTFPNVISNNRINESLILSFSFESSGISSIKTLMFSILNLARLNVSNYRFAFMSKNFFVSDLQYQGHELDTLSPANNLKLLLGYNVSSDNTISAKEENISAIRNANNIKDPTKQ